MVTYFVARYEVQESEFCMSMSYHIKQQVVQDIFSKRSDFLGKRQNWIPLFSLNGRSSKHVESILSIPYGGRVAHCFKLLHHVPYWQNNTNQATEFQIQ